MYQFRVTKYDPARRDASGAYPLDEWTSYSDIDQVFAGIALTLQRYEATEDAYVSAAISFLREAGVNCLRVSGLENHQDSCGAPSEGAALSIETVPPVLRGLLRERFWCRLEAADAFIHVGWDYYMYIGVPSKCPAAAAEASELGLFVESFSSPYTASAA